MQLMEKERGRGREKKKTQKKGEKIYKRGAYKLDFKISLTLSAPKGLIFYEVYLHIDGCPT